MIPEGVLAAAVAANPWFSEEDILRAWGAVRGWVEAVGVRGGASCEGSSLAPSTGRRVGVVMAGNIPFVGLHDMLCVLAAGHECLYKPSSRDTVLIDWVAARLGARRWNGSSGAIDAVIATGGDDSRRVFAERFSGVPTLLRGSRSSVAVVSDGSDLAALADDIFTYSGLGCRSVSLLFLPVGFDLGRLKEAFNAHECPSAGYYNNFRQRRAMLAMSGAEFTEGEFFILREAAEFPVYLSEIAYTFTPFDEWFLEHASEVQCVVGRDVAFGRAQFPSFTDYPDGVDTMEFLSSFITHNS